MKSKVRLDRLLANLGYGTRRTVQWLFNSGDVSLDGNVIKDSAQTVLITEDLCERLQVAGEPLEPLPGMVILLNKPLGFTCSHKEEGDLVYDLLPERWAGRNPPLSTVGRLDKDTSGLLLLTDDGPLLHKLTSPKSHIPKIYLATLERPLSGNEAEIFASGTLMLEGEKKPLLPARLEVLSPTSATLEIQEGRYHQVRRMFAAVGNHVAALHRQKMGGLSLPEDLEAGEYRFLSDEELKDLFKENATLN